MAWQSLSGFLKLKDLRNRLLFTLGMMVVYRLGTHIPVPGIDLDKLAKIFSQGGLLSFLDLFSGGAMVNFSVFAMGIIPYINSSIIMQLLLVAFPQLKEIAEEGDSGRKQIAAYTRYLTIVLAAVQAASLAFWLKDAVKPGYSFPVFLTMSVVSLVAGSTLVMWLGELITERGIGNGASLIIFAAIVSRLPSYVGQTIQLVRGGASFLGVIILVGLWLFLIVGIIIIQEGERRVPVQYAKRIVGRKMYGGRNTFLPLKINQGGVLPIIFASALLQFPLMLGQFLPSAAVRNFIMKYFSGGGWVYTGLFGILIFFFTYFYTAITFNPPELAENIKKYGGFILGVRPGQPTAEYLEKIVGRLTLAGAAFLAIIALVPIMAADITRITTLQGFGGTALLIVVGVALDLVRQVETHLITGQYEGILE